MADDNRSPAQKTRDLISKADVEWRIRHRAAAELEAFLHGDRYEQNNEWFNRDRRLIQIRGLETDDTIRHITAQTTARPRSIEGKPVDHQDDAEMAEVAVALLEQDINDPMRMFQQQFEMAIQSAREKMAGYVMMDWLPDEGEFGTIVDRYVDPRRIMHDSAWHPHHILCRWFNESKRMDVDEAREMYDAPWIQPDRESPWRNGRPDRPILQSQHMLEQLGQVDDDKATIWCCWYKRDPGMTYRKKADTLPPDMHYMSCAGPGGNDGCGFRSPTQGESQTTYPDSAAQSCPICGGDLSKVTHMPVPGKPDGKHLVILAPFSPGGTEDGLLYDGRWPIPRARSFPVLVVTAYILPGQPWGPCDTSRLWDQQLAADQLDTLSIERMIEHRNFWEFPAEGLNDASGERFEARNDQKNVMYRDQSIAQQWGNMPVQLHQGVGLDPQFGLVRANSNARLTQYRGVTDLGFTPESSKNISGVALAQLNQMGEVQTAHFRRRVNGELGLYYGVRWDYIKATLTPKKAQRLNIEGVDLVMQDIWGEDLPNMDFVIEDTPEFSGLEKAQSDAFQSLTQAVQQALAMGIDPGAYVEVFADITKLPKTTVKKMQALLAARQPPMPPGMTPGPGGPPGGMPDQAQADAALVAPQDQAIGFNGGGAGPPPLQ